MNRKRILNVGLKIALVLLVAMFAIYHIHYAPLTVESSTIKTGIITDEVMETRTLEAHIHATIVPKISGRITQILAEAHERGHGGIAPRIVWIGVFALILVTAVVVLTVLVLLLRGKLPPEDEVPEAPSVSKPPATPASVAHSDKTDFAEDPEQAWQRYLEREDEIMALLKQKGRPAAQSELCQHLGLTVDELADALSLLEQRGFVKRVWNRERQDFMVSWQED